MIPQRSRRRPAHDQRDVERHERNLKKFRADEQQIIARFDGDISRFKILKGID